MTGAREQRPAKRPPSLAVQIGKVLYWILFVLSAIVVGCYIGLKSWAKPPKPKPPEPTQVLVTVQPTDNPHTEEDESQGDPTTVPVISTKTRKKDCYTFLVMGMDDGNGNTDTIMAVTFDVKGKHVSVISVPRDTLVDVPRTVKKINAAYSVGGIEEVQKEVSGILGFPVDHYVTVNLRGFKALVDAVGGVDFEVPINMNYDDPTQNLHIHLSKGMQHLDGEKALQLVRFRSGYTNADIGRIETQQKFLKALAKKLISWDSVTKINQFVDIFSQNVKTDLDVGNLAYFGLAALDLDLSTGISMNTLPGNGLVTYKGIPYYYQLYPQQVLDIINQSGANPYTEDLTLEDTNIFQVP